MQVTTATETQEQALELARAITEERLAATAQIVGPITATFWHLEKFGQGEEWQVIFKTTKDRYGELESYLYRNHPWSNPEIVATPIVLGSADYLRWIAQTTTRGSD